MRKFILAAALMATIAHTLPARAGANLDGEWMDFRHHLALNSMPAASEPIARRNYAKTACGAIKDGPQAKRDKWPISRLHEGPRLRLCS